MEDEADCVVDPLVVAKRVVAAFVGDDPNSGEDTALCRPVHRPGEGGDGRWEKVEVGGEVVEEEGGGEVVCHVGEGPEK